MTSNTLIFVGAFCTGSAAVAVAGYILHRKLTAELLEELEEARRELNEVLAEKRELENLWKTKTDMRGPLKPSIMVDYHEWPDFDEDAEDQDTVEEVEPGAYLDNVSVHRDYLYEAGATEPVDDTAPDGPHRIEYQTYLYDRTEWTKLEVEFYLGDETLVDEDDDILDDLWIERTLGIEEPMRDYWERNGCEPEMWWRVPGMEADVDVLFNDCSYFDERDDE